MEDEKLEMRQVNEPDLLDPNPDIRALFCHYNQLYFQNALGACTVDWSSKRMTLCAGICQYMKMGGCAIRLSEPLLKFRSTTDLKNTLLHEMVHAYLWLTDSNKDHNDHGPCFQKMMMEINSSTLPDHQRPACGYSISIYHNFTDEVDNYRTHHWKCQICGDLIRRAMNRQPSASDCMRRVTHNGLCIDTHCHWHQHQKNCCGEYIKIAEPAGYQEKRRRLKISGKQENDGQVKDGTILSKQNKASLVTDHIKEESVIGPSSKGTLPLDFFYPKLEKNVNLCSDESPVVVQKLSEEHSDDILIFKRRKKNPKQNVQAGLRSILMPKADEISECNTQERLKACPSSTSTPESEHGRKCISEGRVKASPSYTLTPEFKQRGKHNPEERVKAGSFLTTTTEAENMSHPKVERRCQKSECAATYGTCEMDFDVIIKWKGWYAFEREDDEVLQPLINKRQERRRHEKMLSSIGIQNGCDTQVSVEATEYKESYNADISIFPTGRTNTTESDTQTSLIKTGNPGVDSCRTTDMAGRETCLTCVTKNLECNCLCTVGSSLISLPSLGSNRTETCLKREESYSQCTGVEEMVSEPSSQRNIQSSGVEVEESCKLIMDAKYSYFGSAGNVGEKSIRSETVDKKEMHHEGMDLDLKGRVSDELAQLDDKDIEAFSPSALSIKHDTGPFNWQLHSKSSGNLKGGTVALDKMNSRFEISDSDSQDGSNPLENLEEKEETFALEEINSSLELSDSESERDCHKILNMGDTVNKKRTSRLLYSNKQSKKERKMGRQDRKMGNADVDYAACLDDKRSTSGGAFFLGNRLVVNRNQSHFPLPNLSILLQLHVVHRFCGRSKF